ncbi:hypothetical protein KL86PLE_100758 [uncultured Pleomorphomonas sp.]|uniref:Uncharacterized protein n=1 Tax=uncultured Pleomorphomonas sp. TaxID=442121 RepID=A0A212L5R0_9HYPH|nr:hypothetical protein KL86PLE_100758 [uncultured Pleomorphomonas sp.]
MSGILYVADALDDVLNDERTLHKRVVRNDMDRSFPLARREGHEHLENKMDYKRAVLATGVADDPRVIVWLAVLVPEIGLDSLNGRSGVPFDLDRFGTVRPHASLRESDFNPLRIREGGQL